MARNLADGLLLLVVIVAALVVLLALVGEAPLWPSGAIAALVIALVGSTRL